MVVSPGLFHVRVMEPAAGVAVSPVGAAGRAFGVAEVSAVGPAPWGLWARSWTRYLTLLVMPGTVWLVVAAVLL